MPGSKSQAAELLGGNAVVWKQADTSVERGYLLKTLLFQRSVMLRADQREAFCSGDYFTYVHLSSHNQAHRLPKHACKSNVSQ